MSKNEEKILTLHPAGKKGTNISLVKYNLIKDAMLQLIQNTEEITYQDLSDQLESCLLYTSDAADE